MAIEQKDFRFSLVPEEMAMLDILNGYTRLDRGSGTPPLEGLLVSGLAINHEEFFTMQPVRNGCRRVLGAAVFVRPTAPLISRAFLLVSLRPSSEHRP